MSQVILHRVKHTTRAFCNRRLHAQYQTILLWARIDRVSLAIASLLVIFLRFLIAFFCIKRIHFGLSQRTLVSVITQVSRSLLLNLAAYSVQFVGKIADLLHAFHAFLRLVRACSLLYLFGYHVFGTLYIVAKLRGHIPLQLLS